MENFQTEEQQVEAIKSFWSKNGNSVIAGLIIGFSGFIGFNYYQDNKLASEVAVSESYMNLQEKSEADPAAYTAEAEEFIKAHGQSSFASFTALSLAKDAVIQQDWAKAEAQLKVAIEKAPDEGVKAIAALRLARIQMQTEQLDAALATLSQPLPSSFLASIEVTKGDAYLLQGKNELARVAYQTAIDNKGLETHPNLQMKLDDLAEASTVLK
ncbi:YfgM family protein [Thalassotalea agariperforans]|mgnify:CR=1 FL=1